MRLYDLRIVINLCRISLVEKNMNCWQQKKMRRVAGSPYIL
jgi:hypothetical protein